MARWSVLISQYAQDIKYIQGKHNHVADALSRAPFQPEPIAKSADDIGCNDLIDDTLRKKIYNAIGINLVRTRAAARLEAEMIVESDTEDETDEEDLRPPLDIAQVRYNPIFLKELWERETNEDPGPQRGGKLHKTSIKRDAKGTWIHNNKTNADEEPLWWVPLLSSS
jgi:hypothetical protein